MPHSAAFKARTSLTLPQPSQRNCERFTGIWSGWGRVDPRCPIFPAPTLRALFVVRLFVVWCVQTTLAPLRATTQRRVA